MYGSAGLVEGLYADKSVPIVKGEKISAPKESNLSSINEKESNFSQSSTTFII